MKNIITLAVVSVVAIWLASGEQAVEGVGGEDNAAASTTCRLIGLGDIHGDLQNMMNILQAAKLVSNNPASSEGDQWMWTGGCATLVQTGDVVDRGDHSIEAVLQLEQLSHQAKAVGGRIIQLLGNHEVMSFAGDVRYANQAEMKRTGGEAKFKSRFAPGGDMHDILSVKDIIATVNRTTFVHAGVLPSFAALGVAKMNRIARDQLATNELFGGIFGDDGPIWTRKIIMEAMNGDCTEADLSLRLLGSARMVIGHTIQPTHKIASYCEGKVIAIDIANSRAIYGRNPGCVEFFADGSISAIYATPAGGAAATPNQE